MTDLDQRQQIRRQWEFAAIVQFLTTFGPSLMKMDEFETEVLEDALMKPTHNYFLTNLHIKLMRSLTDNRNINESTWQNYLKKIFTERTSLPPESPLLDFPDYWALETRLKVIGLHQLCESLLDDPERFRNKLKDPEDQEYWRVDPIGYDSKDNTYWLFDDNRLYIERSVDEDEDKKEDGSGWEPICITLEEWKEFPKQFEHSKSKFERALYKILKEDVVPKVLADLNEKRKQRELELAIENRKRSSRLVVRDLEKLELERLQELREKDKNEIISTRREAYQERREENERKRAEEERERRLKDREVRLKKREEMLAKKKLEDELKEAKEASLKATKERMDLKKKDQDFWMFKCYCGVRGKNLDDGLPMMCCEQCNTWLHIGCVDKRLIKQRETPKDWTVDDYVCDRCIKEEAKREQSGNIDVVGDGELQPPPKVPKLKLILSPRPLTTNSAPATSKAPSQKPSPIQDPLPVPSARPIPIDQKQIYMTPQNLPVQMMMPNYQNYLHAMHMNHLMSIQPPPNGVPQQQHPYQMNMQIPGQYPFMHHAPQMWPMRPAVPITHQASQKVEIHSPAPPNSFPPVQSQQIIEDKKSID